MSRSPRPTKGVIGNRSRRDSKSQENAQTLQEQLMSALERDKQLVVLASALATHSLPDPENGLAALAREVATRFPARFYGLGELLDDLVPTATRLAANGLQPLVLLGSTDLARSYAGMSALCAQHLRVIFLLVTGPLLGQTWQSSETNDLAILRSLPALYIGVPSDGADLAFQLTEAAGLEENPVAIYYHQAASDQSGLSAQTAPGLLRSPGAGRAAMLREGKELALLGLGTALPVALALAARLSQAGHQAAVVDARWVRPLDEALLTAVAHHFPRLVTLEEGGLEGSFGTAVLELLEGRELYETRLKRLEVGLNPNLPALTASITAFLETLERDEGFKPPLPAPLLKLFNPAEP